MVKYVITDGKRWIRKDKHGKYVPTSSGAMAAEFTRKQAEAIFNNSLSKPLKSCFHVEIWNDGTREIEQTVKKITKISMKNNTETVFDSPVTQKWLQKVNGFNGLHDEILSRKQELNTQLNTYEKQILDWRHYIEFSTLNAAQGFKAYKGLKTMLQKRRIIKNEAQVLSIVLDCMANNTYGDIEKRVAGLDNRTYEPRELDEIFDL